jgi:hypothetical protein
MDENLIFDPYSTYDYEFEKSCSGSITLKAGIIPKISFGLFTIFNSEISIKPYLRV